MAKSYPEQLNLGLFLSTTRIMDPASIYDLDINTSEFKDFLVSVYQAVNDISLALNLKENGYRVQEEFLTGKAYFPDPSLSSFTQQAPTFRQEFQKTINFGALPNNTSTSVPHEIDFTNAFIGTGFTGMATNPGNGFLILPYVSLAGNHVQVDIDTTNVTITTNSNRSAYTQTILTLFYIKQ